MVCDMISTFMPTDESVAYDLFQWTGTALWYVVMLVMPGIYFSARRGIKV